MERLTKSLFPSQAQHVLEFHVSVLVDVQFLYHGLYHFIIRSVFDHRESLLKVPQGYTTLSVRRDHL